MKRKRQSSNEPLYVEEHQQPLRKSKRRRESSNDPWDIPVELYFQIHLCHRLYDAVRTLRDADNCLLSEFVVRLPNRRSVPEYYKIVAHPIDLLRIQQKLKTDEYVSVPLFISDIRLLIDNAKLFYQTSSVEYRRTADLEVEFLKLVHELSFSESDMKSPLSPKTVSWKLSSLSKNPVSKVGSSVPGSSGSNKRTPTSVKSTRSKAWLDEFTTSDDPIKIYFADVFSYHDSSGEYISQPFIDLPSEKDYPEYYRIITEPIGLSTIRNQIESGLYQNLKQIQEDLLLMIKNAQYFNEPHSNIYKMASALRKVIINRCIELERKYRTVEKTTKSLSPLPSQKPDDDSEFEDVVSYSDSDGEGESEDGKKKLFLHIKHDQVQTTEDSLGKVLKKKSPPSLKKVLSAVYRTLVYATDTNGRVISDLFMKRPSPKLYPEYYIVITTPIDFKEINLNIKKDIYKSLSEMVDDVELLVNNAVTFNEECSQIHTDALALRTICRSSLERLQAQWPHHFSTTHRKVQSFENKVTTITTLFAVVINCIDSTGRKLSQSFQDPPKEVEGSSGGKKVLGLSAIAEKVDNSSYGSVHELFNDLCSLYNRYCEMCPSQSCLFKDVVSLHRVTVAKYNELTNEQRSAFQYPNAIKTIKNLFRDFINALVEIKGDDGQTFKEAFQQVVVPQQVTDDAKSKRMLSLEKVNQWVQLGRYSRLDQLQNDLVCIFKESHLMDSDDGDRVSRTFEKKYIDLRNNFFSRVLSSSAFQERTLKHIEDEENENEEVEESVVDTTDAIPFSSFPSVTERSTVKYFQIGEVTYFPGDFIYLPPQQSHLPPQIALIESLWTDGQGIPWFTGCWFFRPHETFHIATRKFYEQEVFKSDFYSSGQLTTTLGKCYVLYIKEYTKFFPQGFSEGDVYVCESRYHLKSKSFKRIKFWNVQENVCVKLLPRSTQCALNKVPSVFANEGGVISDQSDICVNISDNLDLSKSEEDSEMNSSEGPVEASLFWELKEVPISVSNPEANCTYYEQYCIDDKVFKLGDFVCVRSDQELPFIARIDRMWTDSNDDPWFRGPWFLRVKEVHHLPTFMFYERELFMSNIHDSNPMRSIMRKCAVLYLSDYIKWRPTEIPEIDVFVCDSRYNEEEKQIKKMKSLKPCDHVSNLVLQDEKYYLPEDLFLWKSHSTKLYPLTVPTPITTMTTTPMVTTSASVAVSSLPPPPPPVISSSSVVSVSSGQVTLSLQQLQSLLTSSLINPKLIQQQQQLSLATSTCISTSQVQSEPPVIAYPCLWEGCTDVFSDISELSSHFIQSNHIQPEPDGNYYFCYWSQCSRKKDHSGKPFDSLQKVTRHVKEVHLLKVYPQITHVKPHVIPTAKDHKKLPTVHVSPLPPLAPPLPSILPSTTISSVIPITLPHSLTVTTTQQSLSESSNVKPEAIFQNATPAHATPQLNTVVTDAPETQESISEIPFSVFVTPPSNQKEIFHSKLYRNYIERMRNNEDTISPQPPKTVPLSIGSDQWIDPKAIPEGMSSSEALYQLYHHMIRDAVNISNWLDTIQ